MSFKARESGTCGVCEGPFEIGDEIQGLPRSNGRYRHDACTVAPVSEAPAFEDVWTDDHGAVPSKPVIDGSQKHDILLCDCRGCENYRKANRIERREPDFVDPWAWA